MRTDIIKDIKLSEYDAFNLMLILQNHIEVKNDEIKKAEENEKAGKPTDLFDNYGDFLAALEASKNHAKRILKNIQKQVDITILHENAINKL